MDPMELITSRRSIRAYTDQPVSREQVEAILQAALRSPSYTNTQPWQVAVVAGERLKTLSSRLHAAAAADDPKQPDIPAPTAWPPAMSERSAEHGRLRLESLGIARDDAEGRQDVFLRNFLFFGAPVVLVLYTDKDTPEWSTFDLGLFTQSICLAARALGLDTCIQASVPSYAPLIKEFLGLAPEKKLCCTIPLGFADAGHPINAYRSKRAPIEEFTTWVGL